VLETLAGEALADDVRPTIAFDAGGRVTGSGGCNRYFGSYAIDGDAIAVGHLGATQMACAFEVMAQEDRFLDALGRVDQARLHEGRLVLRRAGAGAGVGEDPDEPGRDRRRGLPGADRTPPRTRPSPCGCSTCPVDAPAVVLGEQRIQPTGQVPIPFEIGSTELGSTTG
jgi:hypothetical protein